MKLLGLSAVLVGGFAFGLSCARVDAIGIWFGISMFVAGVATFMSACREEL